MFLLLTACFQPVEFHDSIDFNLGFGRAHEHLETPYLLGSSFDLSLSRQNDRKSIEGYRIEVEDDTVLAVLARTEEHHIDVQAIGVGSTRLLAFEPDGEQVGETVVEVREPAVIQLEGAGPHRVGLDDIAEDQEPTILVGGTAKFQLRSFDATGNELAGNGGLEVLENSLLEASVEETYFGQDGNWLLLSPYEAGTHEVELTLVGLGVQAFSFQAVDTIDELVLVGEDESDAEDGESLMVWAHGLSGGEVVQGVEPIWMLGEFVGDEGGDTLHYDFDADHTMDVDADFEGDIAEIEVHGADFHVGDSSAVGCSTSPAAPLGWLAVALGGLLVRRKVR
ncbi:MAG: hypothetical protein GY884_24090 [Proteobacteria bacterium]|nr:hypothetical protein [Pseudomonadota bacterium]